jgi:hypothetical protein
MSIKYPFAMCGWIERCWLFTFREPVADVADLVPAPLSPVTRGGLAFWNVVVCEIADMRPKGTPRVLGLRYRHAAYRLYVRHKAEGMPAIEGLYFLRSDADSRLISTAGKWLSDFNFHHANITIEDGDAETRLAINSPDAAAEIRIDRDTPPTLDSGSPFGSLFEAKAALKYKPFALSPVCANKARVLRVRRDEEAWKSKLVTAHCDLEFFKGRNISPEIAYDVAPIEYVWERGKIA